MTKSMELADEIKALEDKLGSLKAEQQLLKAQESLAREKASSLFEDETLSQLIQKLQNELVKCELGLALSIDYKRNWVFMVRDQDSKGGLSSFKILDPKDKRVFYGLVESFNQVITVEGIQTWLENALTVVAFLAKIKSMLAVEPYKVAFKSYDNALSKLYFTLADGLHDYDCALTMRRPYKLKMSEQLTYDAEYSTIFFLGEGVSLETLANSQDICDGDYLGNFEQKLSVEQSFRKFSELGEVAKELEDKLALFYEALEPRFY